MIRALPSVSATSKPIASRRLRARVRAARPRRAGARLHEELAGYPGGGPAETLDPAFGDIAVPLRLRHRDAELSFLRTSFGTALDVTVAELSIESFFPADARTADAMRG